MRIRSEALDDIRKTRATDIMTPHELEILGDSDARLLEGFGKDASFLEMLGLRRYCETQTLGFINHPGAFSSKGHLEFVNHFVRGAQASWKLGRPTSFLSFLAPSSAGEAHNGELPEGIQLESYEIKITRYTIKLEFAVECGLGTSVMLARARVGSADKGCYKWLSHCPLYRLLEFTRSEEWGDIVPTSENSSKVSPTRRHRHLVKSAYELSLTADQDLGVFQKLVEGCDPVAGEKRNQANAHENSLSRLGNDSKKDKGRHGSSVRQERTFAREA